MKTLILVIFIFSSFYGGMAQTVTATRFSDGSNTIYSCDGVADQVEINNALDYVKGAGGIVELSAHTFVIDSNIFIAGNNTTLKGAGIDQTTIQLVDDAGWDYYYNDGGNWVVHWGGALIENRKEAMQNLTIKDLKIDGNKYQQSIYDPQTGDTIRDIPSAHPFDGQGHYVAIDLDKRNGATQSISDITISDIFIYENSDDGISIYKGKNLTVKNVKGIRGGHSYVYFIDPINLLVEGCDFMVTSNSGIRWYDGNHIIIRNNYVYGEPEKTGNSNFCIEVTSGQSSTITDDLRIENNMFEFTAGAAIALDAKESAGAKNAIIKNNVILQCGNTGTSENTREAGGINIKNFTNTLIENNTIVNCIGGGIRLGGNVGFNTAWANETGLTAIIKNNIITNTVQGANTIASGYGIDVAAGNSAICTFNNVWGNSQGDYFGCTPGIGSISVNPQFKSVSLGTDFSNADDTLADLHLKSQVARWNMDLSAWEIDTITSVCVNGGDPSSDYSNEPGIHGNRINLGAYGNTYYASQANSAPPVANAGPDLYIRDDDNDGIVYVVLDGSSSFDNDTIVSYKWIRTSLQIGTKVIDTIPFVVSQNTISLEVIDNDGIASSDQTFIKILPFGPNINPVADAGDDLVRTDNDNDGFETLQLDAGNSYDPDAIIVSYIWKENGSVIGTGITPSIDFSVGTHLVELTVTDNEGGTNTDLVQIKVRPKSNYALQFNNDFNNEVVITSNFSSFPTYTIEFWVKLQATTGDVNLLWMGGDGKRIALKSSDSYPSWDVTWNNTASDKIAMNQWVHLAFVVNNDSLTNIFMNGVPSTINNPLTIERPTALNLAAYYGTVDTYPGNFVGIMDEIRYWNTARTATEINNFKDVELVGNETGLVSYWNFNDGSGKRLTDLAGNSDGTLFNMEEADWVTDVPFGIVNTETVSHPKIYFYPNPTTGNVFVTKELMNERFTVFSVTGQTILKGVIASNELDFSGLKPGVYFMKIIGNKHRKNEIIKLVKE